MYVGKNVKRIDAYEKVTGKAKYTDDLCPKEALVAKILHSKISNGVVKNIDTTQAEKLDGVVKVVTCMEVPDIEYPTAGHPWSTDPKHQDVCDRKLLNKRVRCYGDDIAAVVAEDEVIANRALELIKVEYEEYEPLLTVFDAMEEGAVRIHDEYKGNVIAQSKYELGNYQEAIKEEGLIFFKDEFETSIVQHSHIENPTSFVYMEKGRIIIHTSTQIPHIVRRVVGQALGIGWGRIKVVKPYVGGGFGNKQEVLCEPLNAYLTTLVGGRCVKLELSRESTFSSTRVRHKIHYKIESAVRKNGRFVARKITAFSDQGAYGSHGHAIVANGLAAFRHLYQDEKATKAEGYTVYTNKVTAGAMRGYGIPQFIFACESHVENIAHTLGIDPCEIRKLNCIKKGYEDPLLNPLKYRSDGIYKCIDRGKELIKWDEKFKKINAQDDGKYTGVGMAIFTYKTGVYPISLETASCRLILNEDARVQVQMGATEIGQGADTVFAQMTADILGIHIKKVNIVTQQDTDITPFDTGAYASRQTYVSGMALKKAAEKLREKIIDYAGFMTKLDTKKLDIKDGIVIDKTNGKKVIPLDDVAMESCYSIENSKHITAEVTHHCTTNAIATGACFAEVEVDIKLCKVNILNIYNIHESGKIINPQIAQGQVHGGMSMGLGYALSEQMIFDAKGKLLNGNFLDYKLPTSMDTPTLNCEFVEEKDPTGPFGNKALGEPPTIPIAPAVRNAVLNATGVRFNEIPMNPQRMFEKFQELNLYKKEDKNV